MHILYTNARVYEKVRSRKKTFLNIYTRLVIDTRHRTPANRKRKFNESDTKNKRLKIRYEHILLKKYLNVGPVLLL